MSAPCVYLVTGCSSGIGLDIATHLRSKGHRVYATARSDADLQRLRDLGLEALPLELSDRESLRAALEQVRREQGRLDGLVNNAWFGLPGAQEDLSMDAWRAEFECLFGTLELTRQCLPLLRASPSGRLVQISSLLGFTTFPFRGAYAASKAALESATTALRIELRQDPDNRIRISVIQPGPIQTRFRANSRRQFDRWLPLDSRYRECYQQLLARLDSDRPTPGCLPASAVTRAVDHALTSPRSRRYYPVTLNTHVLFWIEKLLPAMLKDRLVQRMY